jgi:hypothetical protein
LQLKQRSYVGKKVGKEENKEARVAKKFFGLFCTQQAKQ